MTLARRIRTAFAAAAAAYALAFLPTQAVAQDAKASSCGSIGPLSEGPYDYRTERTRVTYIEGHHFQPQVEALVGGVSGPIGAELNYMLTYVPNHPRVLLALVRYGEKNKWVLAQGLRYSYDCYFDRAIRFRPDDVVVRMIYATYLNKVSRTSEALKQLAYATELAKDDGFAHYNVGMIYMDMKEYRLALAQAHKARLLGFERTELRDRLKAVGKWDEPSPVEEPTSEKSKP